MPVLLRSVPSTKSGQTTLLPPVPDEFEQARDMIAAAVESTTKGTALPKGFPRSMLGRFNSFGRSLRPSEAIELRRRRDEPGPRYNHTVRRKLVLMEERCFSDPVDLTGRIYEADVERGVFHVLVDGQKLPGSFTPEHENILLAALRDHERTRVRLLGTGRYDAQNRLERIEELTDVSLVEEGQLAPEDLEDRVGELTALGTGWLDGDGKPLDPSGLNKVSAVLLDLHEQEDVPIPYVYPRPEGGVQAEWTIGTWELSATIDLTSGATSLDAVDIDTGADTETEANIFSPEGRLVFVQFVTSFQRKGRQS